MAWAYSTRQEAFHNYRERIGHVSRYLVAQKLGKEKSGVTADSVSAVPGVAIIGDRRPRAVLVEADAVAIEKVKERFGEFLNVEAETFFSRS